MPLHLNIEDLLSARTVESDRIEYKEGWNPDSIYRSICAFANDFDNTDGGYILIGVEELNGVAKRPIKGLSPAEIAIIQKEMIGLNNLIRPHYAPKLFVEQVDDKDIIVLWAIAGSERPYEVPESVTSKLKNYKYFIRRYASSIEARGSDKEELIALSNNIPFDDRANTQANVEDISMLLVKEYLVKIQSKLAPQVGKIDDLALLGQMELISGPNEYVFPRNVGLMLFAEHPEKHFPSTQVEIVYFPNGEAEAFTEYEPIKGPISSQIKRTLEFLTTNFLKESITKPTDKAESYRIWNYPLQAIEEILVNAFYHRDYQQREPIEIRIYTSSMIFLNQGGPDRSIQLQAFDTGQVRSRRYRNRRLGEFLKELELTEGRATGIPTIHKALQNNGSPSPRFMSDDNRTFFEVELFVHPAFAQKPKLTIDINNIDWDIDGIDKLLDVLIDSAAEDIAGVQIGDIAGDIAKVSKSIDNQAIDILNSLSGDIAGDIAKGIDGTITDKVINIIRIGKLAKGRREILTSIGLVNNVKNFNTYLAPLVEKNWLTMTIPTKPTSPNQKYITTLKGRLFLELLKYKTHP